jgi:hypothetical protein
MNATEQCRAALEAASLPPDVKVKVADLIDKLSAARLPPEWMRDCAKAVPNDLIRTIVAENREPPIARSGSHVPPQGVSAVPSQGSGWREPRTLAPPPGVALIDRIAAEADRQERLALARQGKTLLGG